MTFNTEEYSLMKAEACYSFKPCYKWMTFNTPNSNQAIAHLKSLSFKPCYKWMTFNTKEFIW